MKDNRKRNNDCNDCCVLSKRLKIKNVLMNRRHDIPNNNMLIIKTLLSLKLINLSQQTINTNKSCQQTKVFSIYTS